MFASNNKNKNYSASLKEIVVEIASACLYEQDSYITLSCLSTVSTF